MQNLENLIYKQVLSQFPKGELEIDLTWREDVLFLRATSKLLEGTTFNIAFPKEDVESSTFFINLKHELLKIEKKLKPYCDSHYNYRSTMNRIRFPTINNYTTILGF